MPPPTMRLVPSGSAAMRPGTRRRFAMRSAASPRICRSHPRLAGSTDCCSASSSRRKPPRAVTVQRSSSCWRKTASTSSCTSRSAPTCDRPHRLGPKPPAGQYGDRGRSRRGRRAVLRRPTPLPRLGRTGARARRGRRADAGRRCGSRWTQGAGVVKALHPFHRFAGRYRNFIEVHLAKSRATAAACGMPVPHVFTTSYLTHDPIPKN